MILNFNTFYSAFKFLNENFLHAYVFRIFLERKHIFDTLCASVLYV